MSPTAHCREVYAETRRLYAWLTVLAAGWVGGTAPAEAHREPRAKPARTTQQVRSELSSKRPQRQEAWHQIVAGGGRITGEVCKRYLSTIDSASYKARFTKAACPGAAQDLARQRAKAQSAAQRSGDRASNKQGCTADERPRTTQQQQRNWRQLHQQPWRRAAGLRRPWV